MTTQITTTTFQYTPTETRTQTTWTTTDHSLTLIEGGPTPTWFITSLTQEAAEIIEEGTAYALDWNAVTAATLNGACNEMAYGLHLQAAFHAAKEFTQIRANHN